MGLLIARQQPSRFSLPSSQKSPSQLDQTSKPSQTTKQTPPMKLQKPELTIDQTKKYVATLVTSKGTIEIALNANQTPITVNNFVYLAKQKFYDNTIFHRVIKGFMIQGGDPVGNGTGGPGYSFADEPINGRYVRGTVAMANAGPNTNGSQFFIMHQDYDLPPNYVIFGSVIKGIEVIDAIADSPVQNSGMGEVSQPVEPISLQSVSIVETN